MRIYEVTDGALCFTVRAANEQSAKNKAEKITRCGLSLEARIIDITDEDTDLELERE